MVMVLLKNIYIGMVFLHPYKKLLNGYISDH